MRRLDEPELEAVLSHELSHVAHRDDGRGLPRAPCRPHHPVHPVRRVLRGAAEPFNAFFFTPALAKGFSISSLFSTHPRSSAGSTSSRRSRPNWGLAHEDPRRAPRADQAEAANLDALFALPTAAVTLESEVGLKPSWRATVCFKPASGRAFADMRAELEELLRMSAKQSGTELGEHDDAYGYHWVTLRDPELEDLVGAVDLVNSSLEDRGFGPQLPVLGVRLRRRGGHDLPRLPVQAGDVLPVRAGRRGAP